MGMGKIPTVFSGVWTLPKTPVSKISRQLWSQLKDFKISISTVKYIKAQRSQFMLKGRVTFVWSWGLRLGWCGVDWDLPWWGQEGFLQSAKATSLDRPTSCREGGIHTATTNIPILNARICSVFRTTMLLGIPPSFPNVLLQTLQAFVTANKQDGRKQPVRHFFPA